MCVCVRPPEKKGGLSYIFIESIILIAIVILIFYKTRNKTNGYSIVLLQYKKVRHIDDILCQKTYATKHTAHFHTQRQSMKHLKLFFVIKPLMALMSIFL